MANFSAVNCKRQDTIYPTLNMSQTREGVGPSALEPFVLAFFPQYKSSEAEGNFKIWYILY